MLISAEVWALVGVVVGALLGGVLQILAGHLEGRRSRAHDLNDRKHDAYRDFALALDAQITATKRYFDEIVAGHQPRGTTLDEAFADLTRARTGIRIYGSRRVQDVSRSLVSVFVALKEQHQEPAAAEAGEWARTQVLPIWDLRGSYFDAIRDDIGVDQMPP